MSKQNTPEYIGISVDGIPLGKVDKLTFLGSSRNDK